MNAHTFDPPLVAILRGLTPDAAPAIGTALFDAGFRLLEVPLNRPGALEAIALLAAMAPAGALVGGGTILNVGHVDAVHAAGGRLLVAPNCNRAVIRRGVELGMLCVPGVATPTEAFDALDAGAHALKIFPAEMVGPAGLQAVKTVLPTGTALWPVGGITPDAIPRWVAAGATGFGLGGALYTPGAADVDVGERARAYVAAWHAAGRQA
jgi:2-dehydro-3-deoxyphosphogalactonate aldolase